MRRLRTLPFLVLIFAFGLYTAACDDDPAPASDVEGDADVVEDMIDDPVDDPVVDVEPDETPDVYPDVYPDGVEDLYEPDEYEPDLYEPDMYEPPLEGILIITEVVDGTLPGGLPKWVELTNVGDGPVDLSEYSVGVYDDDGTTVLKTIGFGATFTTVYSLVLAGTLGACESYVVNFDNDDTVGTSTFNTVYGVDPSNFEPGAVFNGDDPIALFFGEALREDGSDALLIDLYGVIGTDGTGEDWEMKDGYAYRLSSATYQFVDWCTTVGTTNAGCSFDPAEWFADNGGLIGANDPAEADLLRTLTTPFMHTVDSCP